MRRQVKDYRYIYNPLQASFYLQNNIELIETGLGDKGDIFFKFKDSEELQSIFRKWMDRKNK